MNTKISLEEVEKTIQHFAPQKQRRLLLDLPHLLKIPEADLALLKLSEQAFDFWNNPDDEIYNDL